MNDAVCLLNFTADVTLHNGTQQSPDSTGEYRTGEQQWSYAVSLPLLTESPPGPSLEPVVVVQLHVLAGTIGVGVLDGTLQHYLSSEADVQPSQRDVVVELRPAGSIAGGHLMFRNIVAGGVRSRFRLVGAHVRYDPVRAGLLTAVERPPIGLSQYARPGLAAEFDVFVSHTSRRWDAAQCDRSYLARRFSAPDRLRALPPFDSLRPNTAPYHGLLTLARLRLDHDTVSAESLAHYESRGKIVHAARMADTLVVCFDSSVAVFDATSREDAPIDVASGQDLHDPWFAGLHTVMPLDDHVCLLSCAGPDAVVWLDLGERRVIRRWRIPAERYGTNYALDETTSVVDHYIPNDLQLAHLNCASPDPRGGVLVSMLGPGDVGRLTPAGDFELLASGLVGCHGVRFSEARQKVYFVDSCGGRLMEIREPGGPATLFETGSRWLHDAVHLQAGLFLLTMADRNALALVDVDTGHVVAQLEVAGVNGTVQFLARA